MGLHYLEVAAIAQKRRDDALPKEYMLPESIISNLPVDLTTVPRTSGHFSSSELEIIEANAAAILSKIEKQEWSSFEVTKAFCKAATVAQQLTNCITEVFFTEALARAKSLDEHLEKTGSVVGPLHGLPISLKDCFIVPPYPASVGMASLATVETKDESSLVTVLKNLGAVLYIKTNVPTAMMMMETTNNVWGETCGAYNSKLSPGGSSGGEGSLLSMRGAPLGIGTDIGGSIRIPSSFNGLYGLKATFGRFPVWGTQSGIPGQDFIYSNNGPMTRSLETLKLYCKAVLSETGAPWNIDPKCLPVPWRENVIQPKGRKLRFGIILGADGDVHVHPPIQRGLEMTRKALEAAGHEVFEWAPIDHPEITDVMNKSFHSLGGAAIISLTKEHDEPTFPSMKKYEESFEKGESGALGPTKLREMILKRNSLQKTYLDRWNATETADTQIMDGIITPASPWTAPPLGLTQKLFSVSYTGVWNVLDYSACTFPVTFADKDLDKPRSSFSPFNEKDAAIQAGYDPELFHGTPVTLQCVGRRLEDEKVVEMIEVIEEALDRFKTSNM